MEAMQGAILRVKLRHLERWTEARRYNARLYREALAGVGIGLPVEMPYSRHVYHVFAVRTSGRDAMLRSLADAGVQAGIHYPIPVHLQRAYTQSRYMEGDFPVSEQLAREILSLPMFPELTEAQIDRVVGVIVSSTAATESGRKY